jgi:tRNA pseudouridine38-40 synthase
MEEAARFFIGRHDFSAFATQLVPTQTRRAEEEKEALETVREIRAVEVVARTLGMPPGRESGDRQDVWSGPEFPAGGPREILVSVEGSGFLYKMVRTMVGSLVEVGRGRYPPEWIAEVLASKDRRRAGPTAPPHGLCLVRVFY